MNSFSQTFIKLTFSRFLPVSHKNLRRSFMSQESDQFQILGEKLNQTVSRYIEERIKSLIFDQFNSILIICEQMHQEIFPQTSSVYKLSKLTQKIKVFCQKIPNIIQQCSSFIRFTELMAIQKAKKLESGWIMEERLFKNLHVNINSIVYSKDCLVLEKLSKEMDQQKCIELRSKFGTSEGTKISDAKVFINRDRSERGIGIILPGNLCSHWK